MADKVTLREFGARIGLWTDDSFDRNQKRVTRGFLGVAKVLRTVAVQMVAFEAAARVARAGIGDRTYHANIDRLHRGYGLLYTVVSNITRAYADFRQGIGIISEETVEHARALDRQATALGVTTDEFQQLAFAFEDFGLTQSDAITVVERFARGAEDALDKVHGPASEARKQFEALGISVDRLKGEGGLRVLEEIAHAYANAENAQAAKNAIYRLLGEASDTEFGEGLARRLMPALEDGAEGITNLRRIARDRELTIDPELIQQGKELAFQFNILNQQIDVFWRSVGLRLAPAVQVLVELWQDLIVANTDWIETRIDQAVGFLTEGVKLLDRAVRGIDWQFLGAIAIGSMVFLQLAASFVAAAASAIMFAGTIAAASLAVKILTGFSIPGLLMALAAYMAQVVAATLVTLGFDAALTPILVVMGAIAAVMAAVVGALMLFVAAGGVVILVVDDLIAFLAGGDSVIGRMVESLGSGEGALGEFGNAIYQAGRVAWEAFSLVGAIVMELWEIFSKVFQVDMSDVLWFFGIMVRGFAKTFELAFMLVGGILEGIADTLSWTREQVQGLSDALEALMRLGSAVGVADFGSPGVWGGMVGDAMGAYWQSPAAGPSYYYDNRQMNLQQDIKNGGDPTEIAEATRRGSRELMEGSQL